MSLSLHLGGLGRVRPRFGSQDGMFPEEPGKTLAQQQETLRQAKVLNEGGYLTENASKGALQNVKARIKTHKKERNGAFTHPGLVVLAVLSPFMGMGGYLTQSAHHYINHPTVGATPDSIGSAKFFRVLYGLGTTIGGMISGLTGLCIGLEFIEAHKKLKNALRDSKDIEQKILLMRSPGEPTEKLLVGLLEKWIDVDAAALSDLIRETYTQEPEVQPQLDKLYGGKENLPSKETLRNLFTYFVYQALREEHKITANRQLASVSKLEVLEKTYVFLEAALQTGEMFKFVEPDSQGAFGQSFNKLYAAKAADLEKHIAEKLETVKSLLSRQHETDRHIELAQQALLTARLSRTMGAEKTEEIKGIIVQFKVHQQKVSEALEKLKTATNVEAGPLNILNQEFNQLVDYLKMVLTAQQLTELASEKLDVTAELARRIINDTRLSDAQPAALNTSS